jgi:hypothetical protein
MFLSRIPFSVKMKNKGGEMRISRILASVSIVFLLLLLGEGVFPNPRPLENKKIVFEEVGQFNDGGMAVTVLVVNDRAYVCEFDKGLEILDISNPAHIVKLGQIEVTEQARGIEIIGNIAYVSCNTNGLKLFDISDPSKPVYLGQYGDRDGDPHQFLAAGDIGYLTEWHGGFDIIDISDPLKPVRLSQYKDDGLAFSVDIVGSYAFVTEYRAGLKILDISDSKNPVLIGDFNNGGETNALRVVDGRAYVCDKLQGLEILDVSDPAHPHLLGTFNGGGSTVGVRLVDDWAFVINWELGLEAIDVSDPARPVRIGSFYDGGRPNGFQVVGDLIYMADGSDGLEIVRYTQQKDFSVLTGPYLGQKPPGITPKIFEPEIVSTGLDELNSVFSPDNLEYYFCARNFSGAVSIFQMTREGENWSHPKLLPFASRYGDIDVTMSPDGNKILFSSRRPIPGSEEPRGD